MGRKTALGGNVQCQICGKTRQMYMKCKGLCWSGNTVKEKIVLKSGNPG